MCIKTDEICTQSTIGQRITSDHCTSVIEYLTLGNINKSVREGAPLGLGPGYKTCMGPCSNSHMWKEVRLMPGMVRKSEDTFGAVQEKTSAIGFTRRSCLRAEKLEQPLQCYGIDTNQVQSLIGEGNPSTVYICHSQH